MSAYATINGIYPPRCNLILAFFTGILKTYTAARQLMTKVKVLFVCLGNICRSPLAEAIFKHQVKAREWTHWITGDSCGTSNYHIGGSPDPRTMANASKNGIAIDHCGRQLSLQDLHDFDYILAMDNSNFSNILRLPGSEQYAQKVKMMRDFDPLGKGEVPDPYYGGEKNFQEVFDILHRSMKNFLDQLQQNVPPVR
jgi:protein-tyrosine phosphatase